MPFHAREEACGNAHVDKEKIQWDAQSTTYGISLNALMGARSVKTIRLWHN